MTSKQEAIDDKLATLKNLGHADAELNLKILKENDYHRLPEFYKTNKKFFSINLLTKCLFVYMKSQVSGSHKWTRKIFNTV